MSEALWARRALPSPGPGASVVGRWAPADAASLTAHRRQLAAALHHGASPVAAAALERLLLVFEELASNGLRHGRGPVEVTVITTGRGWLLEVTDRAGDLPPVPAVDRDAAEGGLGLHLVARICTAHGWTATPDGRKVVWARIDETDESAHLPAAVPRPRRAPSGEDGRP